MQFGANLRSAPDVAESLLSQIGWEAASAKATAPCRKDPFLIRRPNS
jgi:hypothetical protein